MNSIRVLLAGLIVAWFVSTAPPIAAQNVVRLVPASSSRAPLPFRADQDTDPGNSARRSDSTQFDSGRPDRVSESNQRPIGSDATIDAIWPPRSMRDISLDIREQDPTLPPDRSIRLVSASTQYWGNLAASDKVFAWEAPNIRYQPLYFEDVALERYGRSYCDHRLQTASSAVHFFASALILPYHLHVDHPFRCDYPLGYARPGDCAPRVRERLFIGW